MKSMSEFDNKSKEQQHNDMSKLNILTYPDNILSQPTQPLDDIDGKVQDMIDKMALTMYDAPGIGLASIQVGWDPRVERHVSLYFQGNTLIDVPDDRAFYSDRLDRTEDLGILIDVIAGVDVATGASYLTTQADVGNGITVTAIYTDDLGTAEKLTSAPTAPVTNLNDTPVAVNDTVTAISSYPLTGNVTDNDYDIEGDALIVNENPEANPMHGAVVLQPNGNFEYTADPGYLGDDRFTYVVCDDGDPSLCASAEVIITVEEIPLKVYNAVSPNGDDLNDYLHIEGIEYYPENVLSIYDRYNNLIYETPGYNNDNITWVGQANKGVSKKDLPGDTYFYILNPGEGTQLLKGFIMLKVE